MTPEQLYEELTLTIEEDVFGNKYCRNSQYELHREYGPAVEHSNGNKFWYKHGELHREDGPAIEWASGSKEWWVNGERHREGGPAIDYEDGRKEYWIRDIRAEVTAEIDTRIIPLSF